MSLAGFIAVNLILFIAGFVQGMTAFGSSLVAVPLLVIFLQPRLVVPIIVIHSIFINVYVLFNCRKDIKLERLLWLTVFGIIGIPFGVKLLTVLDESSLKILIGIFISLTAAAFIAGFRKKITNERLASIPIGLLSGVMNGSISMSGPPVIFFFTAQERGKDFFRGNLAAYFLILNIVAVPVYIFNGLITGEVLKYSIYFFPMLAAGTITGNLLAGRVQEQLFRFLALILVLIAGILSFISGLG